MIEGARSVRRTHPFQLAGGQQRVQLRCQRIAQDCRRQRRGGQQADALVAAEVLGAIQRQVGQLTAASKVGASLWADRKSTRLDFSHPSISFALFRLKKKNTDASNVVSTTI